MAIEIEEERGEGGGPARRGEHVILSTDLYMMRYVMNIDIP
jgi:hypothetical protein